MELINTLVNQSNTEADFKLAYGKMQPFNVKCIMHFIFIELRTNDVIGYIYLPDYGPAIDAGNKSIILTPLGYRHDHFLLINQKEGILNNWLQYAGAAKPSLDQMIDLALSDNYELNVEDEAEGFKIKMVDFKFQHFLGDNLIFETMITPKKYFHLSLPKDPLAIGFSEKDLKETKWIPMPKSKILSWFFLLKIWQEKAIRQQHNKFSNIVITSVEPEPENEPDQEPEPIAPEEEPTLATNKKATIKYDRVNKPKKRHASKLYDDSLSNEEVQTSVEAVTRDLKQKLANYKKTVNISQPEAIPQICKLDRAKFTSKNTKVLELKEIPPPKVLTQDEIKNLLLSRMNNTCINYRRYISNFKYENTIYIDLGYDPYAPESFLFQYQASEPQKTYILLCALIRNGFIGPSFSKFYGITQHSTTKIAELMTIIDKFGNGVYDYIINSNDVGNNYMPSAFCRDLEYLKILKHLNKPIEKPESINEHLPFQFPYKPCETIRSWLNNILYQSKMKQVNTRSSLCMMSQALFGFFTQYIEDGKFLDFMRDSSICSSNIPRTQQDISTQWQEYWEKSYEERKLVSNFLNLFKNSACIEKYYPSCASARNSEDIYQVAEYLEAFSQLTLPPVQRTADDKPFQISLEWLSSLANKV